MNTVDMVQDRYRIGFIGTYGNRVSKMILNGCDLVISVEPPETMGRMMIHEGDSIILYPENAHRGAIRVNDCSEVIKIVGKFKL